MSKPVYAYAARVVWEGNLGEGTSSYARYGRNYRVIVAEKPDLNGSADAAFRGERDKHNPEELFLSSISACHMLFYLALCARQGVRVVAYEDEATGTMALDPDGGGRFAAITLHPTVTIARAQDQATAVALHAEAHRRCFIANSCAGPIRQVATVHVRDDGERS